MKNRGNLLLTRLCKARPLFGWPAFLGATLLCSSLLAQPVGRPGMEGYEVAPYADGWERGAGMTEEELEAYHSRRARQLAREYQEARDAGRSLPGVGSQRPVVVPAPRGVARGQEREGFPFVFDRRGNPVPLMPYGTRPVPAPVQPLHPDEAPEWVDPYEQLEREERREPRGWFWERRAPEQNQMWRPQENQSRREEPQRSTPRRSEPSRQVAPDVEGDSQPVTPRQQSAPSQSAQNGGSPSPQTSANTGSNTGARTSTGSDQNAEKKSGGFNLGNLLEPPTAKRVPDSEGMVYSPFADGGDKKVDVRGLPPGTEVKDPYTGKTFIVP